MANFKELKEKITHSIEDAEYDDERLLEIIAEIEDNNDLRETNKVYIRCNC